jgi:quercetin dioxygenase-like cupin family protein
VSVGALGGVIAVGVMLAVGAACAPRGGVATDGAPAAHAHGAARPSAPTSERLVLDTDRFTMYEYVFPPGFRGDEHGAVADEFAYVLDGEFTVLTRGRGRRTLKPGEVEYARKGTVHLSLNESSAPARVLVVLLKER